MNGMSSLFARTFWRKATLNARSSSSSGSRTRCTRVGVSVPTESPHCHPLHACLSGDDKQSNNNREALSAKWRSRAKPLHDIARAMNAPEHTRVCWLFLEYGRNYLYYRIMRLVRNSDTSARERALATQIYAVDYLVSGIKMCAADVLIKYMYIHVHTKTLSER